jgi:ankyrin repeat protein
MKYKSLDECDESGSTALMWACYDEKLEIVELLLENGADVNIVSNTGDTALTIAIREEHVAIVEMLLEYGADTRVKNDRGENPLIMATRLKNTEIVNLLVLLVLSILILKLYNRIWKQPENIFNEQQLRAIVKLGRHSKICRKTWILIKCMNEPIEADILVVDSV